MDTSSNRPAERPRGRRGGTPQSRTVASEPRNVEPQERMPLGMEEMLSTLDLSPGDRRNGQQIVENWARVNIESGAWQAGDRMPSVESIIKITGISRYACNNAYEALQLASYFRVSYATLLYRLLEERIVEREYYEWLKGYSPSRMAWHMGLDPDEFNLPDHEAVHLDRYPVSVIETVKRAVDNDDITPPQAAGLLNVDVYTLQQRISEPPPATEGERREYDEQPYLGLSAG